MKYYKFTAETPYCGTDVIHYEAYEKELTDQELDDIAVEYCRQNAEDYDYMVAGWGNEADEEELEEYYEDCLCYWTEITEKEYRENTEG